MSNPTQKVQSALTGYEDSIKQKWEMSTTDVPTTYQNLEMVGIVPALGMLDHFDDTQVMYFAGLYASIQQQFVSTDLPPLNIKDVLKPPLFSMPTSGATPNRTTDLGKAVYAVDSGHVQIGTSGLLSANFVGWIQDIVSTDQSTMTGTAAKGWVIKPAWALQIGAAPSVGDGGFSGGPGVYSAASTGGVGAAWTVTSGVGGGTATGTGGAGGGAGQTGGAGGAASTTGTGGAGGAAVSTGGAGGATATGTGGAGGSSTSNGGVGGAASGNGTAGAGGAVASRGGAGGAAAGTAAAVGGNGGAWSGGGGAGGTAAGTSAAGAGGAVTLSSGAGGAKTGTGTANGGAGGALAITGGVGGATASTSPGTGGAGASITVTGGAGGAASAGTANGGAGGNVVITPGIGGTSTGGTAGADGGIYLRSSAGNVFVQQTAASAETDADNAITAAQMINGIVVHTVSTGRTLTTPTGAAISAAIPNLAVGDSFMLHVITVGTGADDISTLTAGDGNVTFVGKVTVGPDTAAIAAYGTWIFRNTGTNTWVGYRVG